MFKGYITNLSKYNEGHLIGEWVEFPISEEDLEAVLKRIGIDEEHEEIFFTDWESELELGLGEYEDIEALNELAEELEAIEMHGDLEKLEALMEATGYDVHEAISYLDDAIYWSGYTLEEVAEEYVNDCYHLPEFALRYFDYEAFARDLSFDGYTEVSGGVICIN